MRVNTCEFVDHNRNNDGCDYTCAYSSKPSQQDQTVVAAIRGHKFTYDTWSAKTKYMTRGFNCVEISKVYVISTGILVYNCVEII